MRPHLTRARTTGRRVRTVVLVACSLALAVTAVPVATALPAAAAVAAAPAAVAVAPAAVAAAPAAAPAPEQGPEEQGPVVVVGTGGLHWADVDRSVMPNLWTMVGQGSVGSMSVRAGGAETCRVEGWSTLSATRRPAGQMLEAGVEVLDVPRAAACDPLPEVELDDPSVLEQPGSATIAGWSELVGDPDEPDAVPVGTLGTRLDRDGACATAVGPGAALALATEDGVVRRYLRSSGLLEAVDLAACPVTVVDAGPLAADERDPEADLRRLDDLLGEIRAMLPAGGRVVVAGVHDSPADEAIDGRGLQVVVEWREDGTSGWLTSASTRRPGIVTLADVAATVLDVAGGFVDDLEGAPLDVAGERRMSTERTVENRRYLTELSTTVPHLMPVFLAVLGLAAAAAGVVVVRARRRADGDGPSGVGRRPGPPRHAVAVLLLAAAGPVGSYLAALSRWWGTPTPTVAASLATAAAATLCALLAWLVSRRLARGPWRLGLVVAGLTWLVLTVDGVTGTTLQHGSLLGVIATLGARYFGFGNLTFAVYLVVSLVLAGALAALALARGRRAVAVGVVVGVGLVTLLVDGWPAFGADVGGIFAVLPAFVLLLLAVLSSTPTPRRLLALGGATVATVAVVGVVDWLRPDGGGSHLGRFVQRVVEGDAWDVVAAKAAAAWATVAHPVGAVVAVLAVLTAVVLLGPRHVGSRRVVPAGVADAVDRTYARVPMLRPVVRSIVVGAAIGTLLNDSGIAVGVLVLAFAGVLVLGSLADAAVLPPATVPVEVSADARVRRMPAVVVATGGGLLLALLLGSVVAPGAPATAGAVARGLGEPVTDGVRPVVVVATSGLQWSDVDPSTAPTLWRLLRDGAGAGGVTSGSTGPDRRCPAAGWLALSAGRPPVTGERVDGTWTCHPWAVTPTADGGAAVDGWSALATAQATSGFRPTLGVLGEALGGTGRCATAVGPGAALALAAADGEVARFRTLDDALADPGDAFRCPVTVVDAGSALVRPDRVPAPGDELPPPVPEPTVAPDPEQRRADREAAVEARRVALVELDARVRDVVAALPPSAVVLVADVGDPSAVRPALGVGIADVPFASPTRFLAAPSTRWEGVVRLLDVPATLVTAVGGELPSEAAGSALRLGAARPSDVATTVDQLTALTVRDHALRGIAGSVTTVPALLALLGLAVVALLAGRVRAGDRPARALARGADALLLVLGALPAGLFLMTTWTWWRLDAPTTGMWASLVLSTAVVAGLAALAPWRPVWAAPAVLSAVTALVLTVDAVLGTPLHRGSPLGPAVTLGGRFYGFGNPTYSVYVVATVLCAAVVATVLLRRGRRRLAAVAAAGVGAVALVVDLWPTLGADVGGGLVLVPVFAVVVLAAVGARLTLRRLVVVGAAGLLAVGAIGVLDWLRPAEQRSHLGRFVQSVLDGGALETVARKAGYAADTVTAGPAAWLTLAVVVAAVALVWPGRRWRAAWFDRVEEQWPLVRPVLVALLLAAVGGAVVNDYGVRVATIMLALAVPVLGLLAVRAVAVPAAPAGRAVPRTTPPADPDAHYPAADDDAGPRTGRQVPASRASR